VLTTELLAGLPNGLTEPFTVAIKLALVRLWHARMILLIPTLRRFGCDTFLALRLIKVLQILCLWLMWISPHLPQADR
jgi:hypothetical protein